MNRPAPFVRAAALPAVSNRVLLMGGAVMAAVAMIAAAPAAFAQSQPGGGAPLTIQAVTERPSLNLSAYGEVKTAPDMATISFGVVTEATTAAEAMSQNATRMNQVMAALRRAGIEERDVQTSGLNLSAQYDYVQNEPPRLRGYQASNRVTVIINDLDAVGSTADAVVAAGVNQIDGIGFGLKDPTSAENQARQLAVRNLQAKAALYSQALGVPLGGIRSLTEGGGYAPPQPMMQYARAEMAMDAGSTPVAAGQLTVRIDITGIYDLSR
ncbi:SIMPL domain-containing protein [Brevundimonas sp.]|uniref:SIMPL domain-containing protein n=1 Tax=Brevundimonas sp. TaxID=1871086 RepID=UPI002D6F1F1F|nr:SIMPL domain-containing protein [Brevundimonas sp.]HYC96705.1 SIMPL domain-containing protein [Brevundimonas sp.]